MSTALPLTSKPTGSPRAQALRAIATTLLRTPSLLLYVGTVLLALFLGIAIYYRILPFSTRWLPDLLVLAMVALTVLRVLQEDYVPQIVWLILGVTAIGAVVAAFEGQALSATAWGWWILFQYPLVGLYTYINRSWPMDLAGWAVNFCFMVLLLQVVVQLLQFAAGEPPGDNLTGTFGRQATKSLTLFIYLTVALAYGRWLVTDDWKTLLAVLLAGGLSSVLGAMRLYPIGVAVMTVIAMVAYLSAGKQIGRSVLYLVVVVVALAAFPIAYDQITASTRGFQSYTDDIFNIDRQQQYLDRVQYNPATGTYALGRSFAIEHGWQTLQRDATTLVVGYGIGARALSTSLDIFGSRMLTEGYGLEDSHYSLALIQELGLGGLLVMAGTLLWFTFRLWRCARSPAAPGRAAPAQLRALAYGLMIFTPCWPLWIYYSRAWQHTVPVLLYWGLLGFALQADNRWRTGALSVTDEEGSREDPDV